MQKSSNPPLILVVDDDESIRSLLEDVLLEEGYGVCLATNGREATQVINQQSPSLVLLDIQMPEMNGWQFVEALAQVPDLSAIPIVLLTAGREVLPEALPGGVRAFLPKPFELEELLMVIEHYHLREPLISGKNK